MRSAPEREVARPAPRALDPLERMYWVRSLLGGGNQLMVHCGTGPLEPEALRTALRAAQRRHPFLSARVEHTAEGSRFVFDAPKAPLRGLAGPVARAWGTAAEEDLATPFPREGPLWRVGLLRQGDAWALLLGFDHVVADGRGLFHVVQELLEVATGAPAKPPLPVPPPTAELLPPAARDPALRQRLAARDAARLGALAKEGTLHLSEGHAPVREKRTHLVHARLAPKETEALAHRAKEAGATVQGALAAAMLLAVRDAFDLPREVPMACSHALDLRAFFQQDLGEAVAPYAAAITAFHRVGPKTSVWPLAKEAKAALQHGLDDGDALVAAQPVNATPQQAEAFLEQMARITMPGVAITNMGRLAAPARYGDVTWEGFAGIPAMNLSLALGFADVATLNGQLHFNLVYAEPTLSRRRAEAMMDAALGHLERGTRHPGV